LSFGKGSHIGVRPLASIPLEAGDTPFRYIGFSTSWGFRGFFRVWGADGAIDQTTRTLSVPKPVLGRVSGEQAEITVKGSSSLMKLNLRLFLFSNNLLLSIHKVE
jgi:hypothetical protein